MSCSPRQQKSANRSSLCNGYINRKRQSKNLIISPLLSWVLQNFDVTSPKVDFQYLGEHAKAVSSGVRLGRAQHPQHDLCHRCWAAPSLGFALYFSVRLGGQPYRNPNLPPRRNS